MLSKTWCFVFIALILLSFEVNAQSPYQLKDWKETTIWGGGLGVLTFSRFYYFEKLPDLIDDEIRALDSGRLFKWDRWSTRQDGKKAREWSDVFLRSSFAIPFTMLAGERSRKDFNTVFLFALETNVINGALVDLVKVTVRRIRPLVYAKNEFEVIGDEIKTRGNRTSFFSGHTSTVAAMYVLTAKMYSDYYPEGKLKPVLWASAAAIPALTGFLRMKGGKHFFTDVLVGLVIGAGVGYLVPAIHN